MKVQAHNVRMHLAPVSNGFAVTRRDQYNTCITELVGVNCGAGQCVIRFAVGWKTASYR